MPFFCVGSAATQPSEICEDLAAKPIAAHHALLVATVAAQLGPLAGAVCRALTHGGQMTLSDIAEAVRRDEEVSSVAAAAASRASATGEKTTAVPATHHIGTNLRVDVGELTSANELIHEVAVKEVVTRLVLHRVVYADPSSHLYGLRLGSALLLRVFFPLLLHCVRQQHGEAAKSVLLAVYQLGAVPPASAVRVALSRTPSLGRDALDYAVAQLVAHGWLVPVPGAGPSDFNPHAGLEGFDGHAMQGNSGGGVYPDLGSTTTPFRIGLESALFFVLNDALEQAVAERYADGGLALTLVRALRRRAAPGSAVGDAVTSWQELAAELPAMSTLAGVRRDREGRAVAASALVPEEHTRSAEAVQRCLMRLCQPIVLLSCDAANSMTSTVPLATTAAAGPGGDPLTSSTTAAAAPTSAAAATAFMLPATRALVVQPHKQRGFYKLDDVTVVHLLQEAVCERVVFAGYGVLGVRVMKLLLQHHYLEERTLAEQAVATYTKTRDVLHRMFKDGLLTQQEVPRSGALAERAPKNSIFLWGLSWNGTLLPQVRERLAKTLSIAWVKLREAQAMQQQQSQAAAVARDAARQRPSASSPSPATLNGAEAASSVSGGDRPLAEEAEAQWKYGMSRNMQLALQLQRTVTGLQSCVMSTMRLLLIVDFY